MSYRSGDRRLRLQTFLRLFTFYLYLCLSPIITEIFAPVYELKAHVTLNDLERSFSLNRTGGAENAGVEIARVEKAGAITYGKPSEQKTLKIPGV